MAPPVKPANLNNHNNPINWALNKVSEFFNGVEGKERSKGGFEKLNEAVVTGLVAVGAGIVKFSALAKALAHLGFGKGEIYKDFARNLGGSYRRPGGTYFGEISPLQIEVEHPVLEHSVPEPVYMFGSQWTLGELRASLAVSNLDGISAFLLNVAERGFGLLGGALICSAVSKQTFSECGGGILLRRVWEDMIKLPDLLIGPLNRLGRAKGIFGQGRPRGIFGDDRGEIDLSELGVRFMVKGTQAVIGRIGRMSEEMRDERKAQYRNQRPVGFYLERIEYPLRLQVEHLIWPICEETPIGQTRVK